MIVKPTRREFLKYGGLSAAAAKYAQSQWLFPNLSASGPAGGGGGGGFTFTQSVSGSNINSVALPYNSNIVSGHLLISAILLTTGPGVTTATVSSVTGSRSGAFTFIRRDVTTGGLFISELWYKVAPSSGAETVTGSTASGGVRVNLSLHEYAGVTTLDQQAGVGDGATHTTSPSVTTLFPNELIFGFFALGGGGIPGAGFTKREDFPFDEQQVSEDKLGAAPGSYAATCNLCYTSQIATFH